jgi:predicted transport protein
VNWDQPRVILIAQGFSRYIRAAVQTLSNVELKTYSVYEGNILHVENEYSPLPEKAPTSKKAGKEKAEAHYDLNSHLSITTPEMQKVANEWRDKVLQLPDVEELSGYKTGITYRTTKSFARLEFRKTWVQLLVRDAKYPEDTTGLVNDISANKWGYNGMVKLTPETDLAKAFELIRASYQSTL